MKMASDVVIGTMNSDRISGDVHVVTRVAIGLGARLIAANDTQCRSYVTS
jgi:hypothetical protein